MLEHRWGLALLLGAVACGAEQPPNALDSIGGKPVPNAPKPPEVEGNDSAGAGAPTFNPMPNLPGDVVRAKRTPPPVSGGTLLVTRDEKLAIVSDPDHDQLLVVDLEVRELKQTLALAPHDEPGRAADDAQGRVHVVLRGSGELLSFDPTTGDLLGRRKVCAYPRGLAVSNTEERLFVACAEGQLVTLALDPAATTPLRSVQVDRDLRDVVLAPDGLWLSRFRSAEVLHVDVDGKLTSRTALPGVMSQGDAPHVPSVAWRMMPWVDGGVLVVHQRAFTGHVAPIVGGYGVATVGTIVRTGVSIVNESGGVLTSDAALTAPLPVDVAQSKSGRLLLASAATYLKSRPEARSLRLSIKDLRLKNDPQSMSGTVGFDDPTVPRDLPAGQLVGVAFQGETPVLQYRSPSRLVIGERELALPGDSVEDTGDELFHLKTSCGFACASCHPEGQEDGHIWVFTGSGERRTQSLRGGFLATAPFHWDGEEADFSTLTLDVMSARMGGPVLRDEQSDALAHYLDQLPAMPGPAVAATDAAESNRIERGKQLFADASVGCGACHLGLHLTNNASVDVGTGGKLQVPSLIGIWARAPYLHDGRAKTLLERFTTFDTGEHGNLKGLTGSELSALSAYVETL